MEENKILDTDPAENADILSVNEGTPEVTENEQEVYRVFKTQEEFQTCIDKALGKRLLKARQTAEELESTKSSLGALFESFNVSSVSELSEALRSEKNAQKTETTEVISADALQGELKRLAESEGSIYGIGQADVLLADERFTALLQNGFSVKQAFDALHISEILAFERQEQEQSIIREIRLRGLRPDEAATSGYGSFSATLDPRNLSEAQRADIRERVRRGERITF
ncbi:MAG: hypothetical protein IJ027_06260 [Oscillospiraceae bacterium]|nr:hypothetical protein [Oscillospiraceae bacterium]